MANIYCASCEELISSGGDKESNDALCSKCSVELSVGEFKGRFYGAAISHHIIKHMMFNRGTGKQGPYRNRNKYIHDHEVNYLHTMMYFNIRKKNTNISYEEIDKFLNKIIPEYVTVLLILNNK